MDIGSSIANHILCSLWFIVIDMILSVLVNKVDQSKLLVW